MRFDDKAIIVSGASTRIGRTLARAFAEAGGSLVIVGDDEVERFARELGTLVPCVAFSGRLSEPETAIAAVDAAIKSYGAVDVLVNAWDAPRSAQIEGLSESAWDGAIDSGVNATFNMVKHASEAMVKAKYGRIVNLSTHDLLGREGFVHAAAAAAATISFGRTCAMELGKFGITVNTTVVGDIAWPGEGSAGPELVKPLRRPAEPAEVANAVLFLASDFASYITGHSLFVTGGQELVPALVLEPSQIVDELNARP